MALHGGEDFELLFTVHPANAGRVAKKLGSVALTPIGKIVAGRRLRLLREGKEFPLPVLGFEHF
jgi:thiamine-monophosphate kinase